MYNALNYLIKNVVPVHQQEDVRLDQAVKIYFTEPLDTSTVNSSNFWIIKDSQIERVSGTISYNSDNGGFYIQFIPTANYDPLTTYRVTIKGDSTNQEDSSVEGLKTLLGYGLVGDYYWTFTTGTLSLLAKTELISPSNKVSYIGTPVFSWSSVTSAANYEIAISQFPSFETYYYNTVTTATSINIPTALVDHTEYWWKVRAIDSSGNFGEWSEVWSLYEGDVNQGTVVDEDYTFGQYPLTGFYTDTTIPEVSQMLPPSETLNVNINLNYVAMEINGNVDPFKINNDSIKLIGVPITKDMPILDGEDWWDNPVIPISDTIDYRDTSMTADIIREIYSHGNVPMNITSMYNPAKNKTMVIGTFTDPREALEEYTFNRQNPYYNYIRITPQGTVDGVNKVFELPSAPFTGSLQVFVGGKITTAFSLADNVITMTTAPVLAIEAMYIHGYVIIEGLDGVKNNSNRVFNISSAPAPGTLIINKNGVVIDYGTAYTYTDREITFTSSLASTDKVYVTYQVILPQIVNEIPTGTIDGTNNTFTLSNVPYNGTDQIFVNGYLKKKSIDYTISGNTITFINIPAVSSVMLVSYFLSNPMIINELPQGTIDGLNKVFTINNIPSTNTLRMFANGSLLAKETYTINGSTITFLTSPALNTVLQCSYYTYGNPVFSYPQSVGVTFLYPNNRYVLTVNIDDTKYIGWFTSQYWPMLSTLNDVKVNLITPYDRTDHELYYHIRDKSIEAIFMQTSPMNYQVTIQKFDPLLFQTMFYGPMMPQQLIFGPMRLNTVCFDPSIALRMLFNPNSPMYPAHMYVRLSVELHVLNLEIASNSLSSGGEKSLGDLTIKRNGISGVNAKMIIQNLQDALQPWKDYLLGHTKRGQMSSTWTVKGFNNYNQYNNDYPMKTRFSPRRNYEYMNYPTITRNRGGRTL